MSKFRRGGHDYDDDSSDNEADDGLRFRDGDYDHEYDLDISDDRDDGHRADLVDGREDDPNDEGGSEDVGRNVIAEVDLSPILCKVHGHHIDSNCPHRADVRDTLHPNVIKQLSTESFRFYDRVRLVF